MPEGQSRVESEQVRPLADLVGDIFDRRVEHGNRTIILETYQKKFEKMLETLPQENRNTLAVELSRLLVTIQGVVSEYGARVSDFVRKIVLWPMIKADKNFPKDKYYQLELARAQAWGDFSLRTTKTATAERMAYRNNFMPSALVGAEIGTLGGAYLAPALVGSAIGAGKGAAAGIALGAGGIALGAGIGAAIGGGSALLLRLKDEIMGPPILFYNMGGGVAGGVYAGALLGAKSAITGY